MSELEPLEITLPMEFNNRDGDIVVCGLGVLCSLGFDAETSWRAMLRGRCGVKKTAVQGMDSPIPLGRIERGPAGETDSVLRSGSDPTILLGTAASREALHSAFPQIYRMEKEFIPPDADRGGCVASVSKGGVVLDAVLREARAAGRISLDEQAAAWLAGFPVGRLAEKISGTFYLGGPRASPVAACATGPVILSLAEKILSAGDAPWVLAVSAESSLHPLYLSAFRSMGVLAGGEVDDMRPFSVNRGGFHLGEGASAMVLATREYAESHRMPVIATLAGTAAGCDPTHITAFDMSGNTVAEVIRRALVRAGLKPAELGYINAHGTATIRNDAMEARALMEVLGNAAPLVPISATKAYTGHLLGGTGLMEAAWCILALRDKLAPVTLGLDEPDEVCGNLRLVMGQPEFIISPTALSVNYGFGGHVAAAVFRL